MEVRARDVEAVDVRRNDAGDEEEAVYERVGVGACEEQDRERWEEEVDEGEAEASKHVGRQRGIEIESLRGCCAANHMEDSQCNFVMRE